MADQFTETTKISYGKNIMNSFGGALLGLILFLLSFVVLWKNEGNNVAQIAKANYINKTAIEITADDINRENDNKLVQVSGNAVTDEALTDGIITLQKVFVLSRKVEMYQWEEDVKTESKDELGGSTTETKTYTYDKVWSDTPIDSSKFKKTTYVNPPFKLKSEDYYAKSGKMGDFKLTEKQSHAMNEYSEYTDLPQNYQYKIYNNMYYKGYDPEHPSIGDIRISYEYVPSGVDISIIARQKSDDTLTTYDYKDSTIYLQQSGIKSKTEMVNIFKKNNQIFTNIIRVVGWLLMFIGLNMLISPLVVIFKIVPFMSKIAGFIGSGIMFLVSLALSLLTIAIAWFAYRPVLSIVLLLIIGGIVFAIKGKLSAKTEQ